MRSVYRYNYTIYACACNFMCMPNFNNITARSYIVEYVHVCTACMQLFRKECVTGVSVVV